MRFHDRHDAGQRLLARLPEVDPAQTVVVALPRGGVPVGAVIAEALGIPLDILLVRKVGAPMQPELALGAVTDGEAMRLTINRDIQAQLNMTDAQIEDLARRELPEIERRRRTYYDGRSPTPIAGRTVILVDDGVATGATVNSALRLIRKQHPARLVLALPVAPRDVVARLEKRADQIVCLAMPEPFHAVGAHYDDFTQVTDSEVIATLRRLRGDASSERH